MQLEKEVLAQPLYRRPSLPVGSLQESGQDRSFPVPQTFLFLRLLIRRVMVVPIGGPTITGDSFCDSSAGNAYP